MLWMSNRQKKYQIIWFMNRGLYMARSSGVSEELLQRYPKCKGKK